MKKILYMSKLEPSKDFHHLPVSVLSVAAGMEDVCIYDERVDDESKFFDALRTDTEAVMFSVFTGYQLTQAYKRSKWLKENFPHIKIVWGGPHASTMPDQILASPYVDEVVQGDVDTGEHPLPYHLIDVEKYVNPATKRMIYVTSYGCPGVCTFCATKPRRPFKLLPMERIRADIDNLMAQYPFKQCLFFDATLFTVPSRVQFISSIMHGHKLSWIADARAPEIAKLDEIFLAVYAESGLKQLTIGLESGSQRIIELMQKGKHHLAHFERAAKKLARLPIKMVSGVVFGCPGETVNDLRLTIDYIKRIRDINPNFFISTTFFRPLPGTVMTEMAKGHGYREPASLAEWAELGEQNHYSYNEYRNASWIPEPEEHRKVYEEFKNKFRELFT